MKNIILRITGLYKHCAESGSFTTPSVIGTSVVNQLATSVSNIMSSIKVHETSGINIVMYIILLSFILLQL